MKVYIVWKGHRDYEENVAVCATEELAEGVLAEFGVAMRSEPGWPDRSSLMDAELTPWGIEECEWRGRQPAGPAKARSTDPSTSKLAALRNRPRSGTQRAKLLAAIERAGPRGLTADEAAAVTGIRLNSASTRMSELLRGGHVAESQGGTRRTSGGEQAVVYIAKSTDAIDAATGQGRRWMPDLPEEAVAIAYEVLDSLDGRVSKKEAREFVGSLYPAIEKQVRGELKEALRSDKVRAAGAARRRDRNSMLPWRELGPEMKRVEIEAAGHVIDGVLAALDQEANRG